MCEWCVPWARRREDPAKRLPPCHYRCQARCHDAAINVLQELDYYPWPRRELTHTRPQGVPSLPQRWTAEGRKPSLVLACSSALLGGPAHNQGWPDWNAGLGRRLILDPRPSISHGPLPVLLSHWVTSNALVASCGTPLARKNCWLLAVGCWLMTCFMSTSGNGRKDEKKKD